MVPGLPMVLAWANFHSSFYDILLNRDVKTRASLVGSIARNVTQSSIVWLPPEDISEGNPNRLFAVQLWGLARGTVCNSPSFNFKPRSPDTPSESLPPGPLVTTATSWDNEAFRIIATIAPPFATGVEPSYSSALLPTSTTTSGPEPTEEPAKQKNTATIVVGAVIGTLVVALLIVSGLLWRAKRKRAKERGIPLPDGDNEPQPITHDPMAELGDEIPKAEVAAEMQGDQEMLYEMTALTDKPVYEMLTTLAPIELPAELPTEVLARHAGVARCLSMVSDMTTDSRSLLGRGQVSPATIDPRANPLAKS
ncbi:hypothetical protein PG999_004360 [Apiospora kogelbergensis]|uniref:Uncharacterized protein n=1 Tax=Apiospora kogelbergensis TaxID=1337665 RepID=A0AAW0QZ54_9PEZI